MVVRWWKLVRRTCSPSGSGVEAMGEDVVGDVGGEEVRAGVASVKADAEIGCGDVFVDRLEEMDAGALARGEAEGGEIVEGEAGAADDDPLGKFEEAVWFTPARQIEEAVCAYEVEERVLGVEETKRGEGVDGVVGAAVGPWSVERGGCEAGILSAGELGHGEAVGERGGVAFGFERLKRGGGEEDGVEVEGIGCRSGDAEVAAVGWVKCAAEEGCAHEVLSLDPLQE